MKPTDVKSSRDIDSSKEINDKDPKFKTGDIVRISIYKNIFAKGYTSSWSEEVFVIKRIKTLCRVHMLPMILMEKKLLEKIIANNKSKRV